MKKIPAICLLLFLSLAPCTSAGKMLPCWRDMNVLSVNKEKPRSSFMTFDRHAAAYENSPYYHSLNGLWQFHYTDSQETLPENIRDLVDSVRWTDIRVPGNWEIQGFGTPIYVNQVYEFQPRNPQPPLLPDATPVGVYRRRFKIPAHWDGREVYLHIAGAKSGVYVYLNGREAGYSEDSKNPAEFRINPWLKEGENELVLKIYRWSTGSYLECQDFFRMSGIERDVFLWSQPQVAVRDFSVVSTLDDSCKNGVFRLAVEIKNYTARDTSVSVGFTLLDSKMHAVASASRKATLEANAVRTVDFSADIAGVSAWTSEKPSLYRLLIRTEGAGRKMEIIPFHVGFRRLEIRESDEVVNGKRQRLFYINNQPVKLKGVNLHETSARGGHAVSRQEMRRNLELMKQNNINSIRTSHYPQDRTFYEMCDEYGFYVYDEANIESHGMGYDLRRGGSLGNNPQWMEHHLDRTRNMYERNKNHPCVVIWSLGNEAGNGCNFYQTYRWLKEREAAAAHRPVCYERALWEWNTDMHVPQYPSAAWLEEIGRKGADRPVVPSEYAHAMGNSTGDLYGQWCAIYKYPHLQGGYIWEWIDHALAARDADGRNFWAYGGDFGRDQPSDGNFVADGIVGPDQVPHPAMAEVRYNLQNAGFKAIDLQKGEIEITNRFYFTDLSEYRLRYRLLKNGAVVGQREIPLSLPPQQSTTVSIPVSGLKGGDGDECFINLELSTITPQALIPAGHVIAREQFELPVKGERKAFIPSKHLPKINVSEQDGTVRIFNALFDFAFNVPQGVATSYRVSGVELFDRSFGLRPNFWRAPIDNDYGNGAPHRQQVWKQASEAFAVSSHRVETTDEAAFLTVHYALPSGNDYAVVYRLYASGILHVSATFTPAAHGDAADVPEVPRIGLRFRLPARMDHIRYFGRGPEENYVDRYRGCPVGIYNARAWELYHPYVRPQENGHHTDTRWLAATDAPGRGLLIVADSLIAFNALRNSVEDFDCEHSDAPRQWTNFSAEEIARHNEQEARNVLRKQTHAKDIVPRDFVEICLDMRQQGVGGYDSWGSRPIREACIPATETYRWAFTMIPVAGAGEIDGKARLKY